MENRGRRGRRNRHTIQHTAPATELSVAPASTFGVKSLMVTIVVVCLACSMLQYSCKNSQAKKELTMLANSVNDIAKQLNVIQNSYQLLEDKFAICSQELTKLEKQRAAFKPLAQVMEANSIGWKPNNHSRLPYIDVKTRIQKTLSKHIKNTTKAKNINRLLSEFERAMEVK